MAGFLSPATREQIRAASDIVDVIGSYVPLKRNGANFTALCPFHKEKTPSFNVNPQKQIFHCFGCGKGGDVFAFVKEYENIGFMDAVRRLAERAKIPLEFENTPGAQESRHLKDQLLEIHDQLATRWQNCLANEAAGQLARDYLQKRGVSADAIKLFRIGTAPDLWDDTVNWARSKKFDLVVVEKAGVIIRKEIDTPTTATSEDEVSKSAIGNRQSAIRYYDRFRGRLMFPIGDEQGRIIGFSGRVLSGDEKTAKYVNSPETPIFTKSKIFFGLDKSKRAILDAGYAIICEGQLDLIACFTNGVQNIVAPQGTAFTESHARILKRYTNEVVLCFDSDNAGQNAAVRALDHLLASGVAVRVAVVPPPHDPDSFIKNFGGEKFRELIQSAEGFFDYYLNRLCATNEINSDKGRLAVLRAMAEAVHKTGNAVLLDTHAQKTAFRLRVDLDAVRTEFRKYNPSFVAGIDSKSESDQEKPLTIEEKHLLILLLGRDDYVDWISNYLKPEWLSSPIVREIVMHRFGLQHQGNWLGFAAFLSDFDDNSKIQILLTNILSGTQEVHGEFSRSPFTNAERQLQTILKNLRDQFLDQLIVTLTHKISQPEINDAEKIQLLQEQQKLKKQKRSPLAPLEK